MIWKIEHQRLFFRFFFVENILYVPTLSQNWNGERSYVILFYVRCIVKFVNNKIEGMRENFWGKFSELDEILMKLNEIEALTCFYWGFSNNWKRVNELNYPINPQLNINSMNGFEILIFHRNSRVSHFFNYQSCLLQKIKKKSKKWEAKMIKKKFFVLKIIFIMSYNHNLK